MRPKRNLTLLLFVSALSSVTLSDAAFAEDMLTMPLQCTVQGGRVTLSPLPAERNYKIVGTHENHPFTACAPSVPDVCRTWTVHKFDLACDGGRVAWVNVVAAFLEATPRRAWVEGGRVHFRMGPRWNGPAYDGACDARLNGGATSSDCRRSAGDGDGAVIALPAGFAPMLSTGGRFVPLPPPQAVASAEPAREIKASPPPKLTVEATAKSRESLLPRPQSNSTSPQPVAQQGPTISNSGGWLTTTLPSIGAEPIDQDAAERKRLMVLAMIAAMLATMSYALFLRHRREALALVASGRAWVARVAPAVMTRPTTTPQTTPSAEADAVAAMIAEAVATHQSVRQVVLGLKALTLRDVLVTDLDEVRAALLSPELTGLVAARRWSEVRKSVATVVADLERVRRIAMSAAALESGPRLQAAMPVSVTEALDILGVNADAGLVVVKKIVDALRMSWHPDLARTDEDRQAREVRIRQINVAWDLIAARQKAA